MVKNNYSDKTLDHDCNLGLEPFKERFPWLGGDLQTLRDTFIKDKLPKQNTEIISTPISKFPYSNDLSGKLISLLDKPQEERLTQGLVILIHGLGGSSERNGLRRMASELTSSGYIVIRLNLRGGGPGRDFSGGTYCAKCTKDIFPIVRRAKEICKSIEVTTRKGLSRKIPLFGVGISLGGTILLNSYIEKNNDQDFIFDGLACTSSPLDLSASSYSIERFRNGLYQKWLLNRLIKQTLNDPFNNDSNDYEQIKEQIGKGAIKTIRQFDKIITSPRWGYKDVESYYYNASPINSLLKGGISIPPTLFLHSLDDPWVPANATEKLQENINLFKDSKVIITSKGGHNGFHSKKGCWGDKVVKKWLLNLTKKLNDSEDGSI